MPATKTRKKSADRGFSLIPRGRLLALYAALLKCRTIEEFLGSARGRHAEAAAVAVAAQLAAADTLVAAPRDLLPAFVKGLRLEPIFAPRLAQPPRSFAARLKTALDSARRNREEQKHKQRQKVVAIFLGEARLDSPAQRKALAVAAAEQLPILFVRHAGSAEEAAGDWRYGFPAITADRDDVVAIYRVASEALAHARRGNGPTLIECVPWIPQNGFAADAIENLERYLAQSGIPANRTKARIAADFERQLRAAASANGHRK